MHEQVWVVIPTYNEAENVEGIVRATAAELERLAPNAHRILVVDDNSPDGTGDIADRLAETHRQVEVLHRAAKTGLGHAYLAGFAHALGGDAELVIEMDADFSHDPRYLEQLLAAARDADLVLGSRYVEGGGTENWGILRRMISRGGGFYARTILGVHVHDLTGGFKCIHRRVLETIESATRSAPRATCSRSRSPTARSWPGFRVVEVPIVFRDRNGRHEQDVDSHRASRRCGPCRTSAAPRPGRRRARAAPPAQSDRLAMGSPSQASAIHEGVSRRVRKMTTERHDHRIIARASSLT